METTNDVKLATFLRNVARSALLIIGICVFAFALVSGSEEYGGGISGIIQNSPNSLPWLLLLILSYISWKWELVGGILVVILGAIMMYFFHVFVVFDLIPFILASSITLSGLFLISSWYLRKVN